MVSTPTQLKILSTGYVSYCQPQQADTTKLNCDYYLSDKVAVFAIIKWLV